MWNYRLCKETTEHNIVVYTLREVYYNKAGEIWATKTKPASFEVDDLTELEMKEDFSKTLELMALAKEKEIVDLDTLEFANPDF